MTVNQLDNLNQMRMIAQASLEQKNIPTLINEALRNRTYLPDLNEAEQIIFKIRTELINYINESGIVHGFEWDGNDWPIQNGKIVITKDMIYDVVKKFEFLDADEVEALVNSMFDSQFVVRDENYVHTDNNFTNEEKEKLYGIDAGAEVNKVDDVQVDGNTVLNPETKVADITNEIIKQSYESNPDTNPFTDADKMKLDGISAGAEVNDVVNVFQNGKSVVNLDKNALIECVENVYNTNGKSDGDGYPFAWNTYTLKQKQEYENQIAKIYAPVQTGSRSLNEWANTMRTDHDELGQQVQDQQSKINELEDDILLNSNKIANIAGGTTGQILSKSSDNDYDFVWTNQKVKDVTVNGNSVLLKTGTAAIDIDVTDVQVGGKSVVEGGVAYIPEITGGSPEDLFKQDGVYQGITYIDLLASNPNIYLKIIRFSEFMMSATLNMDSVNLNQSQFQFNKTGKDIIKDGQKGSAYPVSLVNILNKQGSEYAIASNNMTFIVGYFVLYKNADFSGEQFYSPILVTFNSSATSIASMQAILPNGVGSVEAAGIIPSSCLIPLKKIN